MPGTCIACGSLGRTVALEWLGRPALVRLICLKLLLFLLGPGLALALLEAYEDAAAGVLEAMCDDEVDDPFGFGLGLYSGT